MQVLSGSDCQCCFSLLKLSAVRFYKGCEVSYTKGNNCCMSTNMGHALVLSLAWLLCAATTAVTASTVTTASLPVGNAVDDGITPTNDNASIVNVSATTSSSDTLIDNSALKNSNTSSGENETTSTAVPPLTKCQVDFAAEVRNELFTLDNRNLPLLSKRFLISPEHSRCYMTRGDLESTLDPNSTDEAIVVFLVGCLNPQGSDLVFLEDEETEETSASQSEAPPPSPESSGNETEVATNSSGSYRRYAHVISYMQASNCRLNLEAMQIMANMTDFRVLTLVGNRALDLAQLRTKPELCEAFDALKAFGIINDWSAPSYLHHLAECAGHLDNVAEMELTNDSLSSFPEVLRDVVPNLRALEMINNNLTAPVDFPWPPGFATLPRNLSRTYQFNVHYNFAGSFDMQPNLFRRVLLFGGNRIRNLTHFRFQGEFQYISLKRNEMREIAEDVFDNVPAVQYLDLSDNHLEVLPEGLFAPLVNLKRLDLQGNRIRTLPTNVFLHQRSLERLNVEQNSLELLQEGLFTRLTELTELKLKNNSIVEVKDGAFTTLSVKLQSLDLQHNPLQSFPVIVLIMRGLVNTNLENTDIQVLDFVEIGRRTTMSLLHEAVRNPTTGEFVNIKDKPTFYKTISLKHSKLRSVVFYNATRETPAIFLTVIKHYTILMEGSDLTCDCHILNVTHTLQRWRSDGTLTGEEACLQDRKGWACVRPTELTGTLVVALKDEDTYCPLVEEGEVTSCPDGCTCYMRTKVNTTIVDCRHAGLSALPASVPANTREMWLQNNTIKSLDTLPYLAHVHSLKLTQNNLQELSAEVISHVANLRVLHVDDNWLTGLLPDFGQLQQLREVRLAGNPFRCDCTNLWLKRWILSHQSQTEDWNAVKCTTENDDGRVFVSLPDDQFVCKPTASLGQLAVPLAIPLSFAFLLLVLGVVAFLQRKQLKVLLYIHTGYHPFDRDPPDDGALYDVTVCCDVQARAWVLRHVIETLEGEGGYKVFFYPRDAHLGFTTSENVRHCVKNSRRLVAVLGQGWDKNDLLLTATRESLARCHNDLPHFLTVLLHGISAKDVEDKDLRQYVRGGRYLCTEEKHFSQKLLYEMPHTKKAGKERGKARPKSQAPEPIALYDIMAGADSKQKDAGELQGVNQLYPDKEDGVALNGIHIIARQNSQQPSIGYESLNGDDQGDGDYDKLEDKNARNQAGGPDPGPRALQNQVSVDSDAGGRTLKTIFVWYVNTDLPFTLKNIVEPLEKLGHSCILQDRDFPLGAAIQENIVNAVETSERSVFVLSDRTADNDWFNFAFHVAFDRHVQSREQRVALVTREEVEVTRFVEEVQQVVKTSAVLCEDDPWFWKRLKAFVHFDAAEL